MGRIGPPMCERSRDRILKVAARLYALQGYEGTSIRQIAEGARVTKPLIHYHFSSKEHLYRSLLDQALDVAVREAEVAAKLEGSALARLRALIETQVALARRSPEIYGFVHENMTMPGLLPMGFGSKAQGRKLLKIFEDVITEGQREKELRPAFPAHVAGLMVLAALGVCVASVLAGTMKVLPDRLDAVLFDLISHGVEERRS